MRKKLYLKDLDLGKEEKASYFYFRKKNYCKSEDIKGTFEWLSKPLQVCLSFWSARSTAGTLMIELRILSDLSLRLEFLSYFLLL